MVAFKSIILTAALFSGFVSALPTENPSQRPNEIPVKAPDGTPTSDVTEGAKSTSGSNYGSSYDNKGYDNKGYDNKGYDSGNAYTTTSSAMKEESTSSMKEESTSSMMHETMKEESTSSMMHETMKEESTSTSTTYESKATYGSGSTTWGGSGYDDCVAKCVSTYGAPPGTYKPTATSGYEGSTGSGSTVTVLVAPTQGVLRFVPVAVNASIGTTIKFMWGGGPHTVTKGSALLPCNKTSEAPVFVSGQQNKDFVFTQVVNDTKPTYYFCGVATHCQKGMFGMINPPSAFGAATSVGGMMGQLMANDSNLQAYASYTANNTQGKTGSNWGASINLDGMPEWARGPVAENVLFTRNLLAMNPDIVKEDGSIDMSSITNTPLMIPMDVAAQINAAGAGGAGAAGNNASTPANGPASGTSSSAASQPTNSNGASTMASPKVLVALMAVVATFFAL